MSETDTNAPQVDEPVTTDTSSQVDTSDTSTQTVEAPEAAQEQKGSELTATDTAEEKLYAGKYKTPEEMEKAYTELQSKFGQTTSEKAELSRILNEAFTVPEPQTQVIEDEYSDESTVNPREDARDRKVALLEFSVSHPDADGSTMAEVLQKDPNIAAISSYEAKLEYAYLRSQNMTQSKAIAEAEKRGAQATQAKVAEKQVAQVETARTSDQVDEGSALYDQATGNHTREVRDKARLELIRKNLVNL